MKKVACLTELFLLVTLVPLLSALRWEAIHFSLLRSQILTEVRYLEPGKVALLSEFHFNRKQFKSTRIFVLDLDKETLKEIRCPPNIGSMWNELVGVDFNGNVICRALSKSGGYNYYSCNPKTGEIAFIARRSHNTILNGSRYLCEVFATQESRGFTFVSQSIALVWNDLAELGHAEHKQTLDYPSDYGLKPAVIPRSDSFCFIHRATQIAEKKNSMSGDDSEGKSYSNTIPNPDAPDASLVLMRMTPTGPIEIAKWPVDDKAAFRTADGCIGCLSIDGKTINIHDENTGNVRLKIPNTSYTLNGNSQLNEWEMFGTFTRFNDSFGTSHVYNTTTGAALNLGLYSQGRVLGYQDEELLTLTQGTPVNLEIRNSQNGEVNHSWAIPNREIVAGSNPNENTAFSSDGHEIIFISSDGQVTITDKASGKVLRTIQPRFWIPHISVLVCFLTLAWILCWIRNSIRVGWSFWLDECMIVVIASLFLWWRITLSGWQQDYQRIAWHSVVSLLIAFYTLVIHQTVYSRRGLIYRILPIVTIATVFLVSFLFPGVRNRSWAGEFRIQAILLGFLLLLGAAVINRICPTLESKFADPKRGKSFRLSVGHLLLITVYGALVMAALRSVELRSSLVSLKSVLLLMSFYSGLSLAVYFVIHCRGLIWLKSVSVTAILAAIAVCWIYGEAWRNSIHFGTMLATTKHIALLGIATILFGLPILLRPMPESGSSTG